MARLSEKFMSAMRAELLRTKEGYGRRDRYALIALALSGLATSDPEYRGEDLERFAADLYYAAERMQRLRLAGPSPRPKR